jgi:hypothetical protein
MKSKVLSFVAGSALVMTGWLVRPFTTPSAAHAQATSAPATAQATAFPSDGRYQIASGEGGLYYLDTRTGRLWIGLYRAESGPPKLVWLDIDSPQHKASQP